jgi:hypothetical protein
VSQCGASRLDPPPSEHIGPLPNGESPLPLGPTVRKRSPAPRPSSPAEPGPPFSPPCPCTAPSCSTHVEPLGRAISTIAQAEVTATVARLRPPTVHTVTIMPHDSATHHPPPTRKVAPSLSTTNSKNPPHTRYKSIQAPVTPLPPQKHPQSILRSTGTSRATQSLPTKSSKNPPRHCLSDESPATSS